MNRWYKISALLILLIGMVYFYDGQAVGEAAVVTKIESHPTLIEIIDIVEKAERTVLDLFVAEMDRALMNAARPYHVLEPIVLQYYDSEVEWQRIYEEDYGWFYEPSDLFPFSWGRVPGSEAILSQTSDKIELTFIYDGGYEEIQRPLTYTLINRGEQWLITTKSGQEGCPFFISIGSTSLVKLNILDSNLLKSIQ